MIRIFITLSGRAHFGRRTALFVFATAVLLAVNLRPSAWAQGVAQSRAQHDVSLDARNAQGLTPLIVAASAGQTDTVRSLLARGAGIDASSADGRTALIVAAQSNQIETVRALIAAGANVNRGTRGTGTALEVAENKGETQISALLLASGARSSGKSVGDTVCVRPWGGDGFCGTVQSYSVRSVQIQVTRIVGCENGCSAKQECSESRLVGGSGGVQAGDQIAVPSWCLTHTGVKP
jgi:Ankyrin repeats (3 copies)